MYVKTIDTDVLIIGSGAAGLREARKQGVEVLLTSKTSTGLANCSIFSGAGFTTSVGTMTKDGNKFSKP